MGGHVQGRLLPVVVGGDLGVYSLVRAFHEEFGCKAVVVTPRVTHQIQYSSLVSSTYVEPLLQDPQVLVETLERVASEHPGCTLLLLANTDWYVRAIVDNTDRLAEHYLLPFCSPEAFAQVADKGVFTKVCNSLGIPTPATVPVDIATLRAQGGKAAVEALVIDLDFPLVAKPASTAEYEYLTMPGKKKVDHLATRADLDDLLCRLLDAGYDGTFLIQEIVEGDETHMRSLTVYRDTRGKVTMAASGQVLLEEHAPGMLGNPAAILTMPFAGTVDDVTKFLDEVGYTGFADVDFKFDKRTGRHVYFEVNPRIGRNNYFVTAAGVSPARAVVADLVEGRSVEPTPPADGVLFSVVPFRLLLRYITDPDLRAKVCKAKRSRRVAHPMRYRADTGPRRRFVVEAVTARYWTKYRRYYPRPTPDGF
ncbi:MAG: carboxylate--amine ligase [Micrococcales bacterium]|nr:carboxylate--amine ligase [Micrococcales bacterium]